MPSTRLALLSEFELCLGLGEDVNARDSVGKTPLHQAVEVENPSAVTFLLDAGAEINAGAGDNGTPLLHAISNRLRFAFGRLRGISEAAVNALLEAGADVNAPDSAGNTPLLASLSLYPRRPEGLATELAIRLLALGADPNGRDGQGRTPLYVAASVEGQEVVRALLEAGADSHALTDDGASTLHAAAESGSPEVIALLEFGADPEALDSAGQIADPVCHWGPGLTSVEAWGFLAESPAESVRGCLESGIPVDAPDEEGATLLARMVTMRGCCSDFDSVLSVFVGAGADVNARDDAGRTPLHRALGGGGPTSVLTVLTAALLDAGADPNARDLQGSTPLHTAVAALWESSSLVPLLAAGADLNARGGNNYLQGHSPLHYAGSNANPAVAAILLDAGADVNAPSPTGRTPLHEAAANASNPAVIELLAAAGANVNARDANGHTPLHSAAWNNHHPEIATALIAAGADVNARDPDGYDPSGRRANHRTPLLMAVFRGGAITVGQQWPTKFNAPVVEALVRAGADLTLTDESGRTALHEAARYHPAVFPLLLRLGADPNARDAEGNTPLDYALGNRSLEGLPEVRRMREALRNGRAGR